MNYTLPKNAASLRTLISEAIESATTAKVKIQIASVAVLHHAYQHGDYTFANELIEGLGHGIKRDSLVEWFKKFGGLIVSDNASEGFTSWSGKDHIKANFNQAKETMWYELKKANPFQGYSLEDELRKVMKKHQKIVKASENMEEEDKAKVSFDVNEATIQQLLAMCDFEGVINGDDEPEANVDEQLKQHFDKDKKAA